MTNTRLSLTALTATLALAIGWPAQAQLRASPSLSAPRITTPAANSRQLSADYIVAVVNSEPITNNQVRARMLRFEQQLSQRGGALPPREELARQMMEQLISERAQIQYARETGVRVDESQLDNALLSIARQNQLASVNDLRRRMQADGLDYNQVRSDIRDELVLQRLREREVQSRVNITESELSDFMRELRGTADISTLAINLAQILVIVPENPTPQQVADAQAKAQRAAQRAKAGEDFATLVRELSDASAADKQLGGVFGLRPANRYPDLFVDATQTLKAGDVSQPVRSPAGFHVLKVIEREQSSLLPDAVTQTRARHILLRATTGNESQSVQRLRELRQRIGSRQISFEAAAREVSQDGSAREGGDLGWANPGQFVPEFEEAMNNLDIGQVSEPVVSRYGVHLIQVVERRQRKLSEREQRDAAREQLRERKLDEAYASWTQEIRGRAYVEMREPPK
jgi:peptidyl-prolyl cis-trans isomerase SurA